MTNILVPGQHIVIGGLASNYQSYIARELAFAALYDRDSPPMETFHQATCVVDSMSDGQAFIRDFDMWRAARGKTRRDATFVDLGNIRTPDELIRRIDRNWKFVPVVFVRDLSGHLTDPRDLWFTRDVPEILSTYAASVVTAINTGVHKVASVPLTDYRADAHWRCEADGQHVTLTNVADNTTRNFVGRNIGGGLVFDQKTMEAAHG